VLGDGWSLSFDGALSRLHLAEHDKTTTIRCLNSPQADCAAAFLKAVAGRDPGVVAAGYGEALRTLAVCHAATVSAREGRPVALAEVEHPDPAPPVNDEAAQAEGGPTPLRPAQP
jgi:hypothetical protein